MLLCRPRVFSECYFCMGSRGSDQSSKGREVHSPPPSPRAKEISSFLKPEKFRHFGRMVFDQGESPPPLIWCPAWTPGFDMREGWRGSAPPWSGWGSGPLLPDLQNGQNFPSGSPNQKTWAFFCHFAQKMSIWHFWPILGKKKIGPGQKSVTHTARPSSPHPCWTGGPLYRTLLDPWEKCHLKA